jgi:hypothetical protein
MEKASKDMSSSELWGRLENDSEALRKAARGGFLRFEGINNDAQAAVGMARAALNYGESVSAVLLDAVRQYSEAAAKDRDSAAKDRESAAADRRSQARNRVAQLILGVLMLLATIGMVASTVVYTAAARKQTQLMERQLIGTSTASTPAPTPAPVRSAGTSPAPATAP